MPYTIQKLTCSNPSCLAFDFPERCRWEDGTQPLCERCGSPAIIPADKFHELQDETGAVVAAPEMSAGLRRKDFGPGLTEMTEKEYLNHLATNVYADEVKAGYRPQIVDESKARVAREERRHNMWRKRKEQGLDHGVKQEYLEATERYAQEEAARYEKDNHNPERGHAVGKNKIGTITEAV